MPSRPLPRRMAWAACVGMLCVARSLSVAADEAAADAQEVWSTVHINQIPQDEPALVLKTAAGELFTRAADRDAWHLPLPAHHATLRHHGIELVRVAGRPGLEVAYDELAQVLRLEVDPWLLPGHASTGSRGSDPELVSGEFALFGNYQLHATGGDTRHAAAAFDIGASRGRVSAISSWLGIHPAGGLRRLETALRIDLPEQPAYFIAGDSVSTAGVGGSGWRFAGLQWSTDLDMKPLRPAYALPSLQGVASVPSTVDLFVNGALVGSRDVGAGPFFLSDIPVPTGTGAVRLRVRDMLGREQVIEQQFLATPLLLPTGMTTHALEAGTRRRGYGTKQMDYHRPFAAAALRRGMNARLTLEAQLEAAAGQAATRIAAATRVSDSMVARVGFALGSHDARVAPAADLSLDWQNRHLSLSTQVRMQDRRFRDLSMADAQTGTSLDWSVQASPRLPIPGSAGLIHTTRRAGNARNVSITTLFAGLDHLFGGSLGLQLTRIASTRHELQAGVTFVRTMGGSRHTSAAAVFDRTGSQIDWQMGRSAVGQRGWGWHVGTRRGGDSMQYAARGELRTRLGHGDMESVHGRQGEMHSASWSGGWVWAGRQWHGTAPLTQAVALIEAPGTQGTRIFHDGQDLGSTNARGQLVAPSLRPFENNELRLDTAQIPVGVWVEHDQLRVAPYTRGVVRVRFATQGETHAFTLVLPDGRFVPAGARALVGELSYPVGENGRVALPWNPDAGALVLRWGAQGCVAQPPSRAPAADLTLTCTPES